MTERELAPHSTVSDEATLIRRGLAARRRRLERLVGHHELPLFTRLLGEVDQALERFDRGELGRCEVCHGLVEPARLVSDTGLEICLDCMSPGERRALERDLELASQIQAGLLPERDLTHGAWDLHLHWQPLGAVSGDYADVLRSGPSGEDLLVLVGDVSGKGVAAALLMSHLHAVFRGMAGQGMPLVEVVQRANRLFKSVTPENAFATLAAVRLTACGDVEVVSAGHTPPLVVRSGGVEALAPDGLPLGVLPDASYGSKTLELGPHDGLLLYTDGLTESTAPDGQELGVPSLQRLVAGRREWAPREIVRACLDEADWFRRGAPLADDLTLLAVRRLEGGLDRASVRVC
jgi:sigma-B regulation protein RsbU (phosphoserine phosphatase)